MYCHDLLHTSQTNCVFLFLLIFDFKFSFFFVIFADNFKYILFFITFQVNLISNTAFFILITIYLYRLGYHYNICVSHRWISFKTWLSKFVLPIYTDQNLWKIKQTANIFSKYTNEIASYSSETIKNDIYYYFYFFCLM